MNVCARERERERKRRECIREIRKIHAHLIAFVLPHRFDFFLRIQSHVSFFPAYIELRVTYIISRSKKKNVRIFYPFNGERNSSFFREEIRI